VCPYKIYEGVRSLEISNSNGVRACRFGIFYSALSEVADLTDCCVTRVVVEKF